MRSLGARWLQRSLVRPTRTLAGPAARRHALRTRAYVGSAAGGGGGGGGGLPPAGPASAALLHDSRLATLSGLAYIPANELDARLHQHGLELEAHGTTHFTRWFVARHAATAAAAATASAAATAATAAALRAGSTGAPPVAPAADPGSLGADAAQRFIFVRGVSWRSADLDALRVWQGLLRALPTPFLPHLTAPPELLVAHSGVAEMAEELFEVLRPHMEGHARLHLAGHSLGGSLATLVALAAHLKLGGTRPASGSGGVASSSGLGGLGGSSSGSGGGGGNLGSSGRGGGQEPALRVGVTTFGSPPVVALSEGAEEDGRSILQALRLPPGCVRNYVLQDDPVPRALLSADPTFQMIKRSPAVAGLLRMREQWLGQGQLSPTRFLYHPAGDVYLLRWSAEGGHSVRLLAPHTLQEELKLDVEHLRSNPLALMQAVMDHHHGSYSTELRAAATALAHQEAAAAAAAGGGRGSAGGSG